MARSANSSMAWTLIHDATEPALLYFRRAQASNVLRWYFGRFSGWRVVPVWS